MINKNAPYNSFFANLSLELAITVSISYAMDMVKYQIEDQIRKEDTRLNYKLKRLEYILNQ